MNAALHFFAQRPPRTGWMLFGLALAAVLMPASLVVNSSQDINSGPVLLAGVAGLVLGLSGRRWLRALALVAALLVPFMILELVPPPDAVAADLGTLLTLRGPRAPFILPLVMERKWNFIIVSLQAAWQGDLFALNWAIAKLCAMLAYVAALVLGAGLRRGSRLLLYVLPLLATIATVGIIVRAHSFNILAAVFPILLATIVGNFVRRERAWERAGVDFSGLLRSDVAAVGAALLATTVVGGLLIPSAARNPLTRWIWTDLPLPAGLARLDSTQNALSRGDGSLGLGGFVPGQSLDLGLSLEEGSGDSVALIIRSDGLDASSLPYWRGRILDEYTGRRWTTGPIRNVVAPPTTLDAAPVGVIVQQVTDQRPGRQLRYGLPDIVALDTGGLYEEDTVGTTASWIGTAQQYTVYSSPPVVLDLLGPEAIEAQRVIDNNLVLPNEFPQRVRDLARAITEGATTQSARAEALESYLRQLPYSYQVAQLPANGDAVDQFLFTMRQGYCTYYASAMALMAREIGIPSRVAIGYATGEYDAANQSFVVREADAHAWPELYIDGQGWTRWEPTPVRAIPARGRSAEQPLPSIAAPQPVPQPAAGISGWWAVIALVIGLLLLVAGLNVRRLVVPLTPAGVHADLYRWGRRAGVQPRFSDSIEEYAARLVRSVPALRQPVEQVARLLTARVYRSRPLDSDEEQDLVSAWSRARTILRGRRE